MKVLLIILTLSAGFMFSQSQPASMVCDDCPLPDATPTPEPTPVDPGEPPPFGCFYVVVNGVKHLVCE